MAPKPIQLRLNADLQSYVELVAKTRKLSVADVIRDIISRNREDMNTKAMRTPQFIHQMREHGCTWLEIAKRLGEPKTTVRSRYETALATGEVK